MADTEAPLGDAEYRAIEATFAETARGRLFLAEFARRSRKADVAALLTALERLKGGAPGQKSGDADRLAASLGEMTAALEQWAAALPVSGAASGFEGLAAALREAESATSDILDGAEHVQEVAWTLRERGAERAICDLLDTRSSEIYAACALHDEAAKRIGQVLRAGRVLEEQVASLCDEWGVRKPASALPAPSPQAPSPQAPSPEKPAPVSSDEDHGPVSATGKASAPDAAPAEVPPAAQRPEPPRASEPVAEPVPDRSRSRKRQQLAALAGIDSLDTRDKLKLFT
jgi:chemotaxis protein CheZ